MSLETPLSLPSLLATLAGLDLQSLTVVSTEPSPLCLVERTLPLPLLHREA